MGAGRGTSVADDVAGDAAVAVADHTDLQLYTMTATGGAVTTMTDHTNALTANDDSTAPRFPTAAMMRVGSGYSQYEGELDMTILRIWNRVLSASEIIAEVADARSFMSKLGVTV